MPWTKGASDKIFIARKARGGFDEECIDTIEFFGAPSNCLLSVHDELFSSRDT